jgi:hypothetical protein
MSAHETGRAFGGWQWPRRSEAGMTQSDRPRLQLLEDRLGELEDRWRRQGAPIADRLAAGISEDALAALSAAHGLTIPLELKVWWGWHNGVSRSEPASYDDDTIGPGYWRFLSAEESFREYEFNRKVHPEPVPDDKDEVDFGLYWRRSWLPFMVQESSRLYMDCARVAEGGLTPLRIVNHTWENYDVDCAGSLMQAAALWVWALEQNYYWWDTSHAVARWGINYSAVPLFARWTNLL